MMRYKVWTIALGFHNAVTIEANSGFEARKAYATKHNLQVSDVMSRWVGA